MRGKPMFMKIIHSEFQPEVRIKMSRNNYMHRKRELS